MDKDSLAKRLAATFRVELQEHSRNLERNLLGLESADRRGRAEMLEALFRTAHSLKGAARSVNIGLIESCCHRLEEVFGAARSGTIHLDAAAVQVCLEAADAIREAGNRLDGGGDLAEGLIPAMLPRLTMLATGAGNPGRSQPAAAAAPVAESPSGDASARIPAAHLDALIGKSTELALVSRRPTAWLDRLNEVIDLTRRRREDLGRQRPAAAPRPETGPASPLAGLSHLRGNLLDLEKNLQALVRDMTEDLRDLNLTISELDSSVRSIRMLPFSEACERLPRAVRDLMAATGKKVELSIHGGDVRIDRTILQRIKDPLLHMVRNAISHGIEAPDTRVAAGKASYGKILVSARLRGATVEIAVSDDGAGLNFTGIRARARAQGFPDTADERSLAGMIFMSGFSTAATVDQISGRGIGLDVVKSEIEDMRGVVAVESQSGRGTRFTLSLPLTLSTVRGLLVCIGDAVFAIDTLLVRRIIRLSLDELQSVEGRTVLHLDGHAIPVITLGDALGLPQQEAGGSGKLSVVVLATTLGHAAIVVDRLLSETELMVQPLDQRLERSAMISAAALLPDGVIALLLNAAELIAAANEYRGLTLKAADGTAEMDAARKRILVVDDSVTTRTLEQNILEAAGYEILLASDGAEAWQLLQNQAVDLVVSDVEMPRMNGFALTEAIRSSARLSALPVVLVTALASEEDRLRGLQAGADAYLVKSAFDQESLLNAVQQVL